MLSGVRMPPGTLTRIICTSAWRWPYTPCFNRKGVKTALSNSPDTKDADSSSSRTISSSMNGMIDSDDLASCRLSWWMSSNVRCWLEVWLLKFSSLIMWPQNLTK